MKNPKALRRNKAAFSLVEILVVLVVIAALSALIFAMVTRMRKKADEAKQVSILHQIGPLMVLHTTEFNGLLPAGVAKPGNVHWHQALHALLNPDLPIDKVKGYDYWNKSNPLIKNPLYKKPVGTLDPKNPWVPGYGMNTAIVDNLDLMDWANSKGEWQANRPVPLAAIGETSRTPLIAPAPDYHFGTIKANDPKYEQFLINKQIPLLFVDGHVETIPPKEYEARKLHLMPR